MGRLNRRRFLQIGAGGASTLVLGSLAASVSARIPGDPRLLARSGQELLTGEDTDVLAQASAGSSAVPAPDYGAYWGVLQYNIPYELSAWDEIEADVEKSMSVVQFGWPWYDSSGAESPFPEANVNVIRERNAIPCVNWCSWQLGGGAVQSDFRCWVIANGAYDSYIRSFAADVAAWGHPLIIRMNHEMNIDGQFPWNFHGGDNSPEDFVAMWRRVHDIFVEEGATNASWFWCPNVWWPGSYAVDPTDGYPGNDYVDWVGVDGYNWDNMWFDEIFRHAYDQFAEFAPGIPVALGEWGTHEGAPISKDVWILDAHEQIKNNYPRMQMLLWFNELDSGDWPIDSSPESSSAFREALSDSYFLGSPFEGPGEPAPDPEPSEWTDRTQIAEVSETGYVDTGLEMGNWYRYRIRSDSGDLKSGWSGWVQATPQGVEPEPEPAEWTDRTHVADVTETTYVDTDLEPGTWYRYRVRSASGDLASDWSGWVQSRTEG